MSSFDELRTTRQRSAPMAFLHLLLNAGIANIDPSQKRGVRLSNLIGLILFVLLILLSVVYTLWYEWGFIAKSIPITGLLCLTPIVLNYLGYTRLSRICLSLVVGISATAISIYSKVQYYQFVNELDYFSFRFFILASCVLPAVLFALKEKKELMVISFVNLLLLMAYDPLHSFFGVPFPALTLRKSSYDFTNVVIFITYCMIVAAIFFLKWISEKSEEKAGLLNLELTQTNDSLEAKNLEIEAQASELLAQSEALQQNQHKLESAYQVIEQQKDNLLIQNKGLAAELIEKNRILTETNHELIRHNNELSQFAYTVSHNLRGPVASMMGLIQMIDPREADPHQGKVQEHLKNSVNNLDTIIRDLGKIIDIRNDIFRVRQKINLAEEIDTILLILKKDIELQEAQFRIDLSRAPFFFSVRTMVGSILYNLISNALKYRSPERAPIIEVTSGLDEDYFKLTVRDNGLGIDLKSYGDYIFKMYKRFHHHTEGKGLGLYLIKMQAEALNGRIAVRSEVNNFTEFQVFIGIPTGLDEQVLLNEPYAKIFFDATLNSTGVIWRGQPLSEQYRNTYSRGLEFLKTYNTPTWITDLSRLESVSEADQQWLATEIIPQAIRNGLARLAIVRPMEEEETLDQYLEGVEKTFRGAGISVRSFNTFDDACEWVREENAKTVVSKNKGNHE